MGKTILLVEDHLDTTEYLQQKLPSLGYEVRVARDGRAGYEALQADVPAAVVLDLHLPVMSGAELLGKIRADVRTSHLPVILLTADPAAAQDLVEAGRTELLPKAATSKEIATALDQLLAKVSSQ